MNLTTLDQNELYYTPEELSKRLKLSSATIYKLIKEYNLPAIQLGKSYRIPSSELDRYLHQQMKKSGPPQVATVFSELVHASPLSTQVKDLILFGSQARGNPGKYSDVDMILILTTVTSEINQSVSCLATEAMEKTSFEDELSILRRSRDQWEKMKGTSLRRAIERDGISLWKHHAD